MSEHVVNSKHTAYITPSPPWTILLTDCVDWSIYHGPAIDVNWNSVKTIEPTISSIGPPLPGSTSAWQNPYSPHRLLSDYVDRECLIDWLPRLCIGIEWSRIWRLVVFVEHPLRGGSNWPNALYGKSRFNKIWISRSRSTDVLFLKTFFPKVHWLSVLPTRRIMARWDACCRLKSSPSLKFE